MLKIRQEQIDSMTMAMVNRIIATSIISVTEFEPDWCEDKTDEEIKQIITNMVAFAYKNNIYKEKHIKNIIFWYIDQLFEFPLSEYEEDILNRSDFYEECRLDQFFNAITSKKKLVKITLDTDIDSLR